MIDISISEELKKVWPDVALGCIQATVRLKEKDNDLINEINGLCDEISNKIVLEQVAELPAIKDTREAYKKLGKSPSRYRVSSEALIRRVLQGKGVYQINNIVDINNIISLKSEYSVGTYDIKQVKPPILFTIGREGQSYKGIGKDIINIENLPVFSDVEGHFGSPTSDSERAMITMNSSQILMNIISFSGSGNINDHMEFAVKLLKEYADASEIETKIIE